MASPLFQQIDDPPSLPVGTEVSAKYKGAFCEAKVSKVVRNIKVKVAYKHGLGSGIVADDAVKATPGQMRVGATVEVRHPDRKETVEATITKVQDCSQYTVVFDDGDITTLRRTALCLKSGRHFNESETLDQLPLTHPEHFGNPVVGGRRGRRRGHTNEDSSDDEEESDAKEVVNEKEEHIGKVVCVETESKKKDKEKWFPGLVVAPTAQVTVRIRVKDEYLVRSFKDGRYYTVPKKEATEFTREAVIKQDGPAVQAALEYLDADVLPAHWDRDALFGLSNSSSEEDAEIETESSDDEHHEEKDRFVAQLYKYMDDRGTPLNKVPSIQSRDVDLYRLFRAVQKRGGYNRVTTQNQWKNIAVRLGYTPCTVSVMNLVKQAYKKFLQPYGDFNRKLGCSMIMTSRNSGRSKGRSLVRAISVASPKPAESTTATISTAAKIAIANQESISNAASATHSNTSAASNVATTVAATIAQSGPEVSGSSNEPSAEPTKKRKSSAVGAGKVKNLIEKYEEKSVKDECDVPIAKIKAAAAAAANAARNNDDKETNDARTTKSIDVQATFNRDISPGNTTTESSSISNNKKEKQQRKQNQPGEEKRGKRKKDEVTVEKIDTGDFVIETGDKLKVYYHEKKSPTAHGSTYEAKVIEISVTRGTPMYLVHYTGWNNRYDEWISRERIAENITKGSKQKGRSMSSGGNAPAGSSNAPNSGTNSGGINAAICPSSNTKDGATKVTSSATVSSASSSTSAIVAGGGPGSTTTAVSTAVTAKAPAGKRGRGRSDSMPPRSTTPSSVASNSSRTKSPAAANVRKRPTRKVNNSNSNTIQRTSANVSDASMPTESETDSDEPVRKPKRMTRDAPTPPLKGSSIIKPVPKKRATSSVGNSLSGTEEDDEDSHRESTSVLQGGSSSSSSSRGVMTNSSIATGKGRDYDLSLIRSELKGFQRLKSPLPTATTSEDTKKDFIVIKTEYKFKSVTKTDSFASGPLDDIKKEAQLTTKEESTKHSTLDISSECESFNEEDSQSSDKVVTLDSLTKQKFQQKITMGVGKQRSLEKPTTQPQQSHPQTGSAVSTNSHSNTTSRIMEHIGIRGSIVEKRQDNIKSIKEESSEPELSIRSVITAAVSSTSKHLKDEIKVEEKPKLSLISDMKPTSIIAPARISSNTPTTPTTGTVSKYASVIVEKPLTIGKKGPEMPTLKTPEIFKKTHGVTANVPVLSTEYPKKIIEPIHRDIAILKVDPSTLSLPNSNTMTTPATTAPTVASSIVSTMSNTSVALTKPISSMSKNDTSSNTSSSNTTPTSPITTSKDANVSSAPMLHKKPLSPDVYEFKDTEPFEFEIRKSPMVSTSTPSGTTATAFVEPISSDTSAVDTIVGTARNQVLKTNVVQQNTEQHQMSNVTETTSSISSVIGQPVNRKKRGSPIKEVSGAKMLKEDDVKIEQSSNLAADAKLNLQPDMKAHTSTIIAAATSTNNAPSNIVKHTSSSVQQKVITSNKSTNLSAPPPLHKLVSTSQSAKVLETSPFDKMSKSASVNLNISALNEELAQTVEETTRALTDVLQTSPQASVPPPTPSLVMLANTNAQMMPSAPKESTPIKTTEPEGSSLNSNKSPKPLQSTIVSPKIVTPPQSTAKAPVTVGSPFIETRRDLSNVFELSSNNECSGYSSGESKDNKFELENVKILLSASSGGFDLDPVKYEQKPSSIADKVLKAISQKKEEVENNKTKDSNKQQDPLDKAKTISTEIISEDKADSNIAKGISSSSSSGVQLLNDIGNRSKLLSEPLKIQTELPTISGGLIFGDTYGPNTLDKAIGPLSNPAISGRRINIGSGLITLNSPEPKTILETISQTVKNNELTETIQKLECAIQRKTPVGGLSMTSSSTPSHTPTSTAAPTCYFDESIDSTDSEQRLVIEDVPEEQSTTDLQKSPTSEGSSSISAPVKLELNANVLPDAATTVLQMPIAVKPTTQGSVESGTTPSLTRTQTSLSSQNVLAATNFSGRLPSSNTQLSVNTDTFASDHKHEGLVIPVASAQNPMCNTTVKIAAIAPYRSQLQSITSSSITTSSESNVVPIVVPEIPVSVVVASNAVPAVMAAAAAHLHGTRSSDVNFQAAIHHHHQQQFSNTPTSIIQEPPTAIPLNMKSYSSKSKMLPSGNSMGTLASNSPNCSYIESRHNETGQIQRHGSYLITIEKPQQNAQTQAASQMLTLNQGSSTTSIIPTNNELREGAPLTASAADAHNESINLLCEETIPGSPAPAFGGKEDMPTTSSMEIIPNPTSVCKSVSISGSNLGHLQNAATLVSEPNSSPNDSASHDESSEDVKKIIEVDVENELVPLKRKRTRKQTELNCGLNSEIQSLRQHFQCKRRRGQASGRKIAPGSDTDDNSDPVPMRINARQQQMLQQQQQSIQQQQQQTITGNGVRPCPYNFLVELDQSLSSEQCVTILLKQIQDLRKTYHTIKTDLASIDRRRKKFRRREREKKQFQLQNQ